MTGLTEQQLAEVRTAAVRAVERHPSTTFMAPCESLADAVLDAALPTLLARVTALEEQLAAAVESPLAWADQLDAKSLDNFLISLGQATEYEPMNGAISYIHELLTSFRVAVAARGGEPR